MVNVECLIQGKVIIHGVPSRTVYEFLDGKLINQDGILEQDLPDLLNKKQQTGGCCGSIKQFTIMFRQI